jgi:hypothetical protein
MEFTFGIITAPTGEHFVDSAINSILMLNIPSDKFEIIIVGAQNRFNHPNIRHIKFKEHEKGAWITKKKNIIVQNAKFNNIVLQHDYIIYDKHWYQNFIIFGNDFDVCINKIINTDGKRFRDWTFYAGFIPNLKINDDIKKEMFASGNWLIPYHIKNKNLKDYMYISGAYWIAKKHVMEEFPLNEQLFWGESEDIEWTSRVVKKYDLSLNDTSIVRLLKNKGPEFCEVEERFYKYLEEYGNDI